MINMGMGEPTCGGGPAVKTMMHKMKGKAGITELVIVASNRYLLMVTIVPNF